MTGSTITISDSTPVGQLACPEPAQRPDLWPWSARRNDSGQLELGGVSVTELAARVGTPAFVVDKVDLVGRAQVWQTAMAESFWEGYGLGGASVYYAGKAFMCAAAVREMTAAGLGIDTASLGELTCALRAGADPDRVGLHGNNKTDAELELAIGAGERGIGRIIVDSDYEVERVAAVAKAAGRRARVMVRVTTGVHAGGHEFISTAHEDQKFGLSLATGAAERVARRLATQPDLEFVGLHSHIGSQIFDLAGFAAAARAIMQLRHRLLLDSIAVPEVDLGGGYGVAYTGADPVVPTQSEVAQTLATVVRELATELGDQPPHISIEPGRSIAANPTVTLYRVGTTKPVTLEDGRERLYVSIDGGMADNIRPALYGANYTALLANRVSTAEVVRARVVGKHCESGDIVVHYVDLPADITAGDILAIPATGAYGYAMSSNYNMLTKPPVVAVSEGEITTWVRRQSVDDLLSLDCGLS